MAQVKVEDKPLWGQVQQQSPALEQNQMEASPPPPPPPPAAGADADATPQTDPNTNTTTAKPAKKKPAKVPQIFRCDLCDVSLNAQCQFDQHIEGARHKRKLESSKNPDGQQPASTPKAGGKKRKFTDAAATSDTTDTTAAADTTSTAAEGKESADGTKATPAKKKRAEINCDVCKVELTSDVHAQAHFSGKKHAKKVKLMEALADPKAADVVRGAQFFCQFCNINLNAMSQVESHKSGAKHKAAVARLQGAPGPSSNPGIKRFQQPQNKRKPLKCKICPNAVFKSFPELKEHLSTPEHKSHMRPMGAGSYFVRASSSASGNANYQQNNGNTGGSGDYYQSAYSGQSGNYGQNNSANYGNNGNFGNSGNYGNTGAYGKNTGNFSNTGAFGKTSGNYGNTGAYGKTTGNNYGNTGAYGKTAGNYGNTGNYANTGVSATNYQAYGDSNQIYNSSGGMGATYSSGVESGAFGGGQNNRGGMRGRGAHGKRGAGRGSYNPALFAAGPAPPPPTFENPSYGY